MMSVSRQRNIGMTPRKMRRVIDEIRGKSVNEAYVLLKTMPYRASEVVLKKLVEAVASARQQLDLSPEQLVVSRVFVDEGSTMKRFKPRAQGRMYQRLRRSSHLTLEVSPPKKGA
ncbi:MAG: 50S ribosomal protein L22 [Vampirovibrio sp.]|jgi:large subunit ribosomal protein L22